MHRFTPVPRLGRFVRESGTIYGAVAFLRGKPGGQSL